VDVVVRDAKGALVTDLVPEDFELYEDRLRQSIGSFTVANRGTGIAVAAKKRDAAIRVGGATPGSPADADVPDVTAESGLTALVFDRLAPDSRVLAQKAALSGIPLSGQLQDSTAVFAIDLEVNLVQPFTRDPTEVRAGLHRVGGLNASQFQRRDSKIVELQERRQVLGPELTATVVANRASPSAGGTQAIGSIENELAQNRMESRMLEMFDTLEREQQGYSTTNAMLSVVASLQEMPGRKTIVFFSEGLAVPPAAQAAFRSVVDTANRANVTIYAVDASGLRAESTVGDVRREMTSAGIDRIVQIESGALPLAGSLLRGLERNERHRRLPHPRHQQPAVRVSPDRRGHAVPLRPHLRASEPELRWAVPRDRRQGAPPGNPRVRASRLFRRPVAQPDADPRLRKRAPGGVGPDAAAQRVSDARRRVVVPGERAAGPHADSGRRTNRRAVLRSRQGRWRLFRGGCRRGADPRYARSHRIQDEPAVPAVGPAG
jgi:VWFA-related protein